MELCLGKHTWASGNREGGRRLRARLAEELRRNVVRVAKGRRGRRSLESGRRLVCGLVYTILQAMRQGRFLGQERLRFPSETFLTTRQPPPTGWRRGRHYSQKQSFPQAVPKQSLGTRGQAPLPLRDVSNHATTTPHRLAARPPLQPETEFPTSRSQTEFGNEGAWAASAPDSPRSETPVSERTLPKLRFPPATARNLISNPWPPQSIPAGRHNCMYRQHSKTISTVSLRVKTGSHPTTVQVRN
jgi:hypothetical protein